MFYYISEIVINKGISIFKYIVMLMGVSLAVGSLFIVITIYKYINNDSSSSCPHLSEITIDFNEDFENISSVDGNLVIQGKKRIVIMDKCMNKVHKIITRGE